MIKHVFTIIKKTKAIDMLIDIQEMKKRIHETYEALHAPCKTLKGEKLISIVIPTRNERARITALLNS